MADNSAIEWCATWQPITGCQVVSPGCTNCYAMRLAGTRLQHHSSRAGLTRDSRAGPVRTGEVRFNEQWLDQPLRWRRPRRIFVAAHGDLFAEGVSDEWIDRVFAVMALAPQHQFLVLTKRAERMRDYITNRSQPGPARDEAPAVDIRIRMTAHHAPPGKWAQRIAWPLPQVWLGVSVEDQQRADERIPHLLATPAALRFVSAEPLLAPLFLTEWLHDSDCDIIEHGIAGVCTCAEPREVHLDWVIAGGESGPGARPMLRSWAQSLRDQCRAAGVPYFFKQHGEWIDADEWLDQLVSIPMVTRGDGFPFPWMPPRPLNYTDAAKLAEMCGNRPYEHQNDGSTLIRVGKAAAGRLLDGREHSEFPA